MSELIQKKKRGRKPKNYNIVQIKSESKEIDTYVNTDEEQIILHLPITLDEINNDNQDMELFIKSENEFINTNNKITEDSSEILRTTVNNTITNQNFGINNSVNKITTTNLVFTQNTKCWWCRNSFNTPPLQLADDYFNNTFYSFGHFCSWNCKKKYNLELNDSLIWKRDSLINLEYFLTYGNYIDITPAPHWMCLEEYGGNMSLEEFRKSVITNTKEYLVLHPPLISRQMQIEESYKTTKIKEVPIDKINKIYSEIDSEYTIKRNKPIQTNQLNLENTMGLIKKKKSKGF